ncbi:MAG: xanthine dehydrogenase family protein molybdopterin-binding subunit [Acidobacteriota bacterium]|nr:xanthine dehydrogenase family protein molybdopterin-binding subunit [Acidobacteriota bacterium]
MTKRRSTAAEAALETAARASRQGQEIGRRDFLKAGGALVIAFSSAGVVADKLRAQGPPMMRPPGPDPRQIDTWLAIHSDNTATVYIGYVELGQGSTTSLLQISAEELDFDLSQVSTVRVDTNMSPNQGGTNSSSAIARGSPAIRQAAAEARQALLKMASQRLGVAVEQLAVSKGVVSVAGTAGKSVTYGELIGDKRFNVEITGKAPLKPVAEYTLVGSRPPRNDIPAKVRGTYTYLQHVRLPGMLHGRIVRPRGQGAYGDGAKIKSLDENSIAHIPGARMLRKGDFVGVVAFREWDAIRAARDLKIEWDLPETLPGSDNVYAAMRGEQTIDHVVLQRGDIEAAFTGAAPNHIAAGTYHGPYQAHATFGPNGALADVRSDSALLICSSQDVYTTRGTVARLLGLKPEQVRAQYYEGSGTYGHSCYDDAAQAAAILSQLAGKPVRLQFMRWDEHGWDPYGPAHVGEVRIAADANGKIIAYQYDGWHHNWAAVESTEQLALGTPAAEWRLGMAQQVNPSQCGGMYSIPNIKLVNHQVNGLKYLKAAWLRSPLDLSFSFASEQTMDELARMLGMDAYAFRRANIANERWQGVLDAVARASKWEPRPPASQLSDAAVARGRGIALGTHLTSYGGAVAEVEVNKESGVVAVKHLYGAIDAGLAVNPAFIENQISGQLVQATSRMLKEEVTFNKTNVTSLDWNSYPILRFEECPEVTPIVVQQLDQRSTGAGEEVMAAAAGAIACAFFDATGVRMTAYPLTPKRVLPALRRS